MPTQRKQRDWQRWLIEFMEYESTSVADFLRSKGIKSAANYTKQTSGWGDIRDKFNQERLEAKKKNIIKNDEENDGLFRKIIKAALQQEALLLQNNIRYSPDGKPVVKNAILVNIASQVIERLLKSDRLLNNKSTENIATSSHKTILDLLEKTQKGEVIQLTMDEVNNLPLANVQIKNETNRRAENIPEQDSEVADSL